VELLGLDVVDIETGVVRICSWHAAAKGKAVAKVNTIETLGEK
jgi:hypothetical protein